jgi:hypothetical protein
VTNRVLAHTAGLVDEITARFGRLAASKSF